jgi:hypothetical protein
MSIDQYAEKPWIYRITESQPDGTLKVTYPQGWDEYDLLQAQQLGHLVERIDFKDGAFDHLIDDIRRGMAGRRFDRDVSDEQLGLRVIGAIRSTLLNPPLDISSVSSVTLPMPQWQQPDLKTKDHDPLDLCPFCRRADIHDEYPPTIDVDGRYFSVHAPCCDFYGPLFSSPAEAAKAWNRRPS